MRTQRVFWVAVGLVVAGSAAAAALFILPSGDARQTATSPTVVATIVIDAGSGGYDPGAVYAGVEEEDVNLTIAERVKALAETDRRLRVVMTRTLDVYTSLDARVATANAARPALYLSIQANASGQHPEAAGIETWVASKVSPGSPSWQFAEILQSAVIAATGARDRGVKSQELYIGRITSPAALLETGFLSNAAERDRLQTPLYQEQIATGIVKGILAYLEHAIPQFAAGDASGTTSSQRDR
ncbi:MAG: N-acetylmuramoyl-L-alanine amidase [Candidatus Bipolaricaulota bacterium]